MVLNMEREQFRCDIAHAIESGDFTILQKLESVCRDFRGKIATRINDTNIHGREYTKKQTVAVEEIARLEQEIESLKAEQDKASLQQKIINKKIIRAVQKHEELVTQINEMKVDRDNLSLEIIDHEQVLEERKQKKQSVWNAIKKACQIYKEVLNIHITLINPEKECDRVKISFFTNSDKCNDDFHVCLQQQKSHWSVEQIQPTLSKEQIKELKKIVDFSKQITTSDLTNFLCNLRHIFVKYYANIK